MAVGKRSFLFYSDWIETFKELPKDKGYDLLMHILQYVNDENPETEDVMVKALFSQIKNTLKRDLEKWEKKAEQNRENGNKGGRPKKPTETETNPENPVGYFETQDNPEKPVSVSVSVNVSDSVNDIEKKIISIADIDSVYSHYPTTCPVNRSSTGKTSKNKGKIKELLKKRSVEELKDIIDRYISDCKKYNRFIKNFSTFLNNVPDYEETVPFEPVQPKKIYPTYEDLKL